MTYMWRLSPNLFWSIRNSEKRRIGAKCSFDAMIGRIVDHRSNVVRSDERLAAAGQMGGQRIPIGHFIAIDE